MDLTRGALKAPVYTDWTSVANIAWDGVSGLNIVMSANILIRMDTLPPWFVCYADFSFDMQVTAGAGVVLGWVRFNRQNTGLITTDASPPPLTYIPEVQGDGTKRNYTPKAQIYGPSYSDPVPYLFANVRGVGTGASTAWAITDIKARLMYIPL